TGDVDAAVVDAAFLALNAPSAARTGARHTEVALLAGAPFRERLEHIGDDVARSLDEHVVADADVLALDLVHVVERSVRDRYAADVDRFERGDRSDHAGAADARPDIEHPRGRLPRLELVGDRPPRRTVSRAEAALQPERVDLQHHSIDL